MKKLLITGASSFTAPYIASEARSMGFRVVATSLTGKNKSPCYDELVQCDITKLDEVRKAIIAIKPSKIIHLAGLSFVGHDNPEDFYHINVVGTDNILTSLNEIEHNVSSILISSSANIYGTPDVECIDESIIPNPVNHYAASKLAMEHIARTYSESLPIIITRPFNYIGHGQNLSFLVPKIVNAFATKKSTIELGNIKISRDFSSVYDTAKAYSQLITCNEAIGETFNVCSGHSTSLEKIISSLAQISNREIDISVNPAFVRKNEIPSLTGSNSKLLKFISHWKPTQSLNPILTEMYELQTKGAS